jgi:hypothetical protein
MVKTRWGFNLGVAMAKLTQGERRWLLEGPDAPLWRLHFDYFPFDQNNSIMEWVRGELDLGTDPEAILRHYRQRSKIMDRRVIELLTDDQSERQKFHDSMNLYELELLSTDAGDWLQKRIARMRGQARAAEERRHNPTRKRV